MQAIVLGAAWPAALYLASALSEQATRVVALVGAAIWIGFTIATAFGADLSVPVLGTRLKRVAESEGRS